MERHITLPLKPGCGNSHDDLIHQLHINSLITVKVYFNDHNPQPLIFHNNIMLYIW